MTIRIAKDQLTWLLPYQRLKELALDAEVKRLEEEALAAEAKRAVEAQQAKMRAEKEAYEEVCTHVPRHSHNFV